MICHVINARGWDLLDVEIRVGMDGGGGTFKVVASFQQKETESEDDTRNSKEPLDSG